MAKAKRGNPNMRKGAPSINPSGRKRKSKAHSDGWASMLTGLGRSERDKRLSVEFVSDVVTHLKARELWRGDDIAARAVELPADDMTRAGFDCLIDGDKDTQDAIENSWKNLGMVQKIKTALEYERAYGGAAIIIGAKDGAADLAQPLNVASVKSLDYLTVLEPRELIPFSYYEDPGMSKFGEVSQYQLAPIAANVSSQMYTIHETRLCIFPGIRITRERINADGWGDSIFNRVQRVLRDFNIAWGGTGILISDFSQAVYKMKNLASLMANSDGEQTVQRRMTAMEMARSVARATVIDSEDDFERKTTSVIGLAELLREYQARLAAAVGLPVTLLFGLSPGGMNATGASDIRLHYDKISSGQEHKVVPHIEKITQILLNVQKKSDTFSISPRSLWQETEQEKSVTRKTNAETDALYIDRQVVTPEEIALSRFGGDRYSGETVIDFEDRESLAVVEDE